MKYFSLLTLISLLSPPLSFSASAASDSGSPLVIATYKNNLFFSPAPEKDDFSRMANKGITIAIDLREPGEAKGFEAEAGGKNHMTYFSSPLSKAGPIENREIKAIESILDKHAKEKIWIFCSSGNRAGAVAAIHIARKEGLPTEEAIRMAKSIGLNREEMISRVRTFLKGN